MLGLVFKEGCSVVVPRSKEVKVVGKNGRMEEWREEPALEHQHRGGGGLRQLVKQACGGCGCSGGWALLCGNAGGGTQKVRGWQRPKIASSDKGVQVVGQRQNRK